MSLSKLLLLEFNKRDIDYANALGRFLSTKNFIVNADYYNRPDFVGKGVDAVVFTSETFPEKVIRITEEVNHERKFSDIIGKNFDNVVEVYFSKTFSIEKELLIVVMEKLEPVDGDIQHTVLQMINIMSDVLGAKGGSPTFFKMYFKRPKFLDYIYENADQGELKSDIEDMRKYLDDVKAGYEELQSTGIDHKDLHVGNVMMDPKTKNYKLIDIA